MYDWCFVQLLPLSAVVTVHYWAYGQDMVLTWPGHYMQSKTLLHT
jgi:hypothetical protein